MDVQHGIFTCHEILKHLSKFKIRHFNLDYGVGFASLICGKKKTNIESFKDRRKTVRLNIYCKSIDNGVIKDTHCNGPLKTRTTR